MLDEECIVPKATDLTLAQKLIDQHLGILFLNRRFKTNSKGNLQFQESTPTSRSPNHRRANKPRPIWLSSTMLELSDTTCSGMHLEISFEVKSHLELE